jgi:nitrate reductase NapE component
MAVERKVLRSISEFSMFKYLLIIYLIFFILSVIVMAIIGFIVWRGLSSFGIDNINSILASLGLGNINISDLFGRGMIIGIVISIVGGLIASVFYAAVGTLVVWIMNVVLKISGGIELRFLPGKEEKISIKE